MAEQTYDFEGSSDETAIAAGQTGSGDPFDLVSFAGSGVYDSAYAAHGSLSGRFTNSGTTNSSSYVRWDESGVIGTLTDHYGRFYFYFTSLPSTARVALTRQYDGTSEDMRIEVLSTGAIRVYDDDATTYDSTATVSTGTWYRIEYHLVNSTTTGTIDVRLYTGDSTTITETISTGSTNTGLNTDRFAFGCLVGDSNTTVWLDEMVAGATAWPGPAASSGVDVAATPITGTATFITPAIQAGAPPGVDINFATGIATIVGGNI